MSPVAVSVHEFLSHGQGIWRTGYSLPICNSSTCQKSIITSLVFPPPLQSHPPCFFHIENHTNSCFSYQAVFLTLLIIPMAFLWAVCLQVVTLRFIAQNWTQYFISQMSSAPLNTFVFFGFFSSLFEDFCLGSCLLFLTSNCRTLYFHYLVSHFFLAVFPHFNKIPLNSNNIFWQAQNISEPVLQYLHLDFVCST